MSAQRNQKTYQLHPIGSVRVSEKDGSYTLQIDKPYRPALKEMARFSHIMIFWWADKMDTEQYRAIMTTELPYAPGVEAGVFACRSEYRPNPIAVTTMMILEVDEENGIVILPWIDADDGTPLLDIKPYIPISDRIRDYKVAEWAADWPKWMEDAAAGYSLYHFIRTFNQIVQHTPYDYLMRRRLSESARELLESQRLILDIALDYQFNNHETYSRAFKRMFAMQPSQWRSGGKIPYRSLLPPLSLAYLEHINQAGIPKPQFIERNKIDLVGLMDQGDEINFSFWQRLESVLADQKGLQPTQGFYEIHMIHDQKVRFCFVGVETLPGSEVIPPLCRMQIPGGAYVQFLHRGMRGDLPLSLDYIYHTWLVKSNYQITHPLEIEYYPDEMPLENDRGKNCQIQLPITR